MSEIPLLSPRPLREFTPEEYKRHVESLYFKPEPRASERKAQEFTFHVNKKGTLILRTVKRSPKFLTEPEMKQIAKETGKRLSEIFIKMKEKGWELRRDSSAG